MIKLGNPGSAGGLAKFNCSGNRRAPGVGVCFVPPHTSPLPEERESAATPLETSDVAGAVTASGFSFRGHATIKLGRIIKAWANVSPSPRGEGWGEGEQDTRNLGRLRFELGA